ncbi:MAG: hypothetical protein IT518_09140 [Burkholderiales bacterium]|nr:hypothetical protein [Burkholderiales bacterium]
MRGPCIDACALRALAERDPETLLGPLLWLLTRLARREDAPVELTCAIVAHSTALAAHPGVALELRLAAGSLAIEHRPH